MYAEAGRLFPYFQCFSQDVQHLEEFCRIQKYNAMSNPIPVSTVSEYDLGGEGDLFKAPEPIIEEPLPTLESLDPMTAAFSMISGSEDVVSSDTMKVTDLESIQNDHLLSEVFYDCKKDLLAKSGMINESFPEASDVKLPAIQTGSLSVQNDQLILSSVGPIQKSVSSGCLNSMEWISSGSMKPRFLDFQPMDLGAAFRMRRAFSEGDIQTLGSRNTSLTHSSFGRMLAIGNCPTEERKQKLSRYRKKKSRRNFGRKIKYACRKALADSQPRVRGRFAKTEEADVSFPSK